MPDTLGATVQLAVIAMSVVFGVLAVLGLVITASKLLFGPRERPAAKSTAVVADAQTDQPGEAAEALTAIPPETVAVITAAVYACLGQPQSLPKPALASLAASNAWLWAGRQRLMAARQTGRR